MTNWYEWRKMQHKLLTLRGFAESSASFASRLRLGFAGPGLALAVRMLVLLAALGILYLRSPITFTHPQFWGEDAYFFHDSLFLGWSSFSATSLLAGYLCTAQALVAFAVSFFNPVYAAAIYCYTAIFFTLAVVWLVTSPRLDIPCKPLLAISVVIVPMGYEELGTLTNIQWILPIGAFALMFMQAARSRLVLLGEAGFVALMAFSGPFSIFLTPMFIWRLLTSRGADKSRMFVLTAIAGLGALTQILFIAKHFGALNPVAPAPYSRTLWVNLPASHIMADFGKVACLFHGIGGAVLGLVCVAAAGLLAVRAPYRTQKIFLLLFSLAIAISGMYKFREALATQVPEQRYFYSGSVFLFWFICCISSRFYVRACLACLVAAAQFLLLPVIANTPRDGADLEWPVWSSYISSGLPVIIPIAPPGFYVGMPASPTGPLVNFESWTGKNFAAVAQLQSSLSCAGEMDPVEPLTVVNISELSGIQFSDARWSTSGWAWDEAADGPVKLVVLVDSTGKVLGFGLPKFKTEDGTPRRSKWNAIFYAAPGSEIRAYAILRDGRHICPLANQDYFPLTERPLASAGFAQAMALLPGSRIVQRFKPLPGLVGLSETFVTFAHVPSKYTIHWRIDAYSHGHVLELGTGEINASTVSDWQHINLPMVTTEATPDEVAVSFQADTKTPVLRPAGIPLFIPGAGDKDSPVEIDGVPDTKGLQLGLIADYKE
jgi:hypothetical protein